MGKDIQNIQLNKFFLLTLFLITFMCANGQSRFAGRLVDKASKQALIGATIIDISDPLNNTISDESGIFYINNAKFTLQLRISYIGYDELVYDIAANPGIPQVINLEESG